MKRSSNRFYYSAPPELSCSTISYRKIAADSLKPEEPFSSGYGLKDFAPYDQTALSAPEAYPQRADGAEPKLLPETG